MIRGLASIMLLLCLVSLPGVAIAENFRVGYFEDAPLSFTSSESLPSGFAIDVLNEIAARKHWNLTYKRGNRLDNIHWLEQGAVDVVAVLPFSYDFPDTIRFTTNSIVADWGAVYVTSLIVDNIQDLEGRHIGVAKGDPHAEVFKKLAGNLGAGFTLIQFDSYVDVFKAIKSGVVDAGIANRLFGLRHAEAMGVHSTSVLFNPVSIRFGVSRGAGEDFLNQLNDELGELKAESASPYHLSMNRWLAPIRINASLLDSPYIWWGGIGLCVLLLSGGFWVMRRLSATTSEVSRHEEALKKETKVRKRAQVALWESVERHRAMFTDNMLPQLLVKASTSEIVEVNPSAETFYGHSPGSLIGMSFFDINAEPLPKVKRFAQEIEQGRNRLMTKHRTGMGKVYDVELFISTLYIHEEMHNLITVVDISERVAAEKARMASEERLDLAVKGGDLAFWDWDLVTGSMIFNDHYAEMLGFNLSELGSTYDDWVVRLHPDDYDRVLEDMDNALDVAGASHNSQMRMRTRSGEWRWFASRGRVSQRTESGQPLRMTGVAYDITERMETEYRLARINECLLGFVPEPDENISRLTDLAGELFGGCAAFYCRARHEHLKSVSAWNVDLNELEPDVVGGHISYDLISRDLVGLHVVKDLPNTPYAETDPDVKYIGAKTYIGQIVRVAGRAAGVLCIFFSEDYDLSEADEKLLGIIVAALRVEEERNIDGEKLVEAKEAAESANRAKSEFLANMSHEIRTPLNGIFGMLQLVGETELDTEQEDFVQTALTSGRSLLRVINDVLDFSKMEAGMLSLVSEPFDFRHMVSSVLDNFTVQAAEKNLTMSVKIYDSLPEIILGDEARIRQILFNLVGNAVKFTPEGHVIVEAWVLEPESAAQHLRLFIVVEDSGIGIPDDMVDSVFSAFSQADGSYTRQYGGTGLGLGIVKRLVNLMGGELAVESGEEGGTRINLFVNVQAGLGSPVEVEADLSTIVELDPLSILLVEDERVNRLSVQRHLEKLGHTVTEAEDGLQAIDLLKWNDFDVILMDIQMPNMDGLSATRFIREEKELAWKSDIPIVALTAHAMKGDREKFLAAGMDDYLAKPVEFVDLVGVLSRITSKLRERQS